MAILNFSISNAQITDEYIYTTNANPLGLYRSTFYNKTGKLVVIRTATGGGGTLLVEGTDYTISGEIATGNMPVDGSGDPLTGSDSVWSTLSIDNATYQSIALYVTYYPIGDFINADTFNRELPNVIESTSNIDLTDDDYIDGLYQIINTNASAGIYMDTILIPAGRLATYTKSSGDIYPTNEEKIIGDVVWQLPGESSPTTLKYLGTWAELTTIDGSAISGEFFRLGGGEASSFESGKQEDAMQRITGSSGSSGVRPAGPSGSGAISIGTSSVGSEYTSGGSASYALLFDSADSTSPNAAKTDDVETRPVNRTIKLWKRTA